MKQLLADDPVESEDDDDLSRVEFAKRAVVLLNKVREQSDSSVLGLIGPWGSGKSSLLKFIERGIQDSGQWTVGHFAPWNHGTYESAVHGFFNELRVALPKTHKWSTTRQTLSSLTSHIAPLGGLGSLVGVDGKEIVEKGAELIGGDASPSALQRRAETALRGLQKPVLMILDDLDRLEPRELLNTFRLVRLVGRLPNVYYIVSYDEMTLLDVLQRTDLVGEKKRRAQDYLEKMIQVRLDVPPLLGRQVLRLFNTGFNQIATNYKIELSEEDSGRLGSAFFGNMERWLTTPRAIRRYLAQLDAFYEMTAGEVDFVDFALMTFLRTFEPNLYWQLYSLRTELTHRAPNDLPLEELQTQWRQRLAEAVGADKSEAMFEILSELFIPVMSARSRMNYGAEYFRDAASKKRVTASDYFNRYYHYGVPEGDISDRLVAELVVSLDSGFVAANIALKALMDAEPELVRAKLDMLEQEGQLGAHGGLRFLSTNFGSMPEVAGMFVMSLNQWSLSLGRRLLIEALDADPGDAYRFMVELADGNDAQLVFVARLLDVSAADSPAAQNWRSSLIDSVLERIKARLRLALKSDGMSVADDVFDLVWQWKHLGSEEEVTRFLWDEAIVTGNWSVDDVLIHLVSVGTSYGGGRPKKSIGSFDLGAIDNLLGINRLLEVKSADLDALDEESFIGDHAAPTNANKLQFALQQLYYRRRELREQEEVAGQIIGLLEVDEGDELG